MEEDDCEDDADDDSGEDNVRAEVAEVAEESDCVSIIELDDGNGDSVLRIEDGPTGILPLFPAFCPFNPPPSPCWLASVELENLEAILTCVYYILDILKERKTVDSTSARQMAIVVVKKRKHGPAKERRRGKGGRSSRRSNRCEP